ncbi:MAG: hypothetical protein J6X06_02065 [Elusimicrobiaceae bacterium]|nr:hypothetical protein [Elusimicrobiaceae bacterium]
MTLPFVIALDQGTSSCRAMAVDQEGHIRAQRSVQFSPVRQAPGLSQYRAEDLLAAQTSVLNGLLDEIGPQQVAALAVCSQRSTVVLWDKNTGKSVAPVLTWEDGRAQQESNQAPLSQAQVHQVTGLFKTPYFSAPKITWCLKNFPEAAQAARANTLCVAPVASYFIWQLTQGSTFAVDPTLAQRTLLWDIQTGDWSETLCRAFEVPLSSLPSLRASAADYGSYLYKGVSIPIYTCVADQQAAAFYHGLTSGKTSVNYGTGAFVLHHTGSQLIVLPGMLSSVAATTSVEQRAFLLEGPVFAAGSVFQWLQSQGIYIDPTQVDNLCTKAEHPVSFLPALGGLGAPYWDYNVGPVPQKVDGAQTPQDWVAGALRGIAHLVADITDYLRVNAQAVTTVEVSGGLSQSVYLLQCQANFLNVSLYRQNQTEATVLGTALLAWQRLIKSPLNWQLAQQETVFPNVSAEQSQAERRAWKEFVAKCRGK